MGECREVKYRQACCAKPILQWLGHSVVQGDGTGIVRAAMCQRTCGALQKLRSKISVMRQKCGQLYRNSVPPETRTILCEERSPNPRAFWLTVLSRSIASNESHPSSSLPSPEAWFTKCPYTSFYTAVVLDDPGTQRSMMVEPWVSASSSRIKVLQ